MEIFINPNKAQRLDYTLYPYSCGDGKEVHFHISGFDHFCLFQ